MNRYLAAQSAIECEALRAFAKLVAEFIAAFTNDSSPTELTWKAHAWLVEVLTYEQRAEVTNAMVALAGTMPPR
jgi:hypothetical protein